MQQGQSVLLIDGTVGDPASGSYAYTGIVVDAAGVVHAYVLGAGPATDSCFVGFLTDREGNVLASASVNSPNEFESIALTGVTFEPAPGRASHLFESNIGGGGAGDGDCP